MRDHARRVAALGVCLSLSAGARAALPCDADLNGDGAVGIVDFLGLLEAWGTNPGGPPDLDGDGTVSVTDMLDLLASWGPIAVSFGPPMPDAEAKQIGLEMLGPAGPLFLPPATYERIHDDLLAIRHDTPALAGETHSAAWLADQLLVGLVGGAPLDLFPCLNAVYQVIGIDPVIFNVVLLTFAGDINVERLATIYTAAPEVQFAEPNGLIGGQNFWTPVPLGGDVWQWSVDDGFLDCFDGCDCHRLYVFQTDGLGNVTLISYQEVGQPWCTF
jgi:hypothetical protein